MGRRREFGFDGASCRPIGSRGRESQHHQQTRTHVAGRGAEGKTKAGIIRCLKRRLARELYGPPRGSWNASFPASWIRFTPSPRGTLRAARTGQTGARQVAWFLFDEYLALHTNPADGPSRHRHIAPQTQPLKGSHPIESHVPTPSVRLALSYGHRDREPGRVFARRARTLGWPL